MTGTGRRGPAQASISVAAGRARVQIGCHVRRPTTSCRLPPSAGFTDRLNRLVGEGVLERVPYSERPTRYEYRLTAKGRDLNIALSGLRQWGDKYLNEKPPRLLRRKADKKPVIAAFVPKGADVLRFDELELVPGPGLKVG